MFGGKKKPKTPLDELEEKLDRVLFDWPNTGKREPVRISDLLRGTVIFGGTGSGKTSGSGNMIAKAFIEAGFGGVILCAKPDEGPRWKKHIEAMGRRKDMVYFSPTSGLQFNPVVYENERSGSGSGETLNLVDLIMNIHLLGQNYMSGSGGGSNEGFWDNALRRCLSRAIDLLKLAEKPVSIPEIREIVLSALRPEIVKMYNSLEEKILAFDKDEIGTDEFMAVELAIEKERQKSFCLDCLLTAYNKIATIKDKTEQDKKFATYNLVKNYYFSEFAYLSDRTRSSIEEHFYGLAEPFLRGILEECFGQEGISPELWPEKTYQENRIIILDFSVKEYLLAGIYAQGLYKYIWQQAMERRRPLEDGYHDPVFLWVDESHYFINPNYDTMFQTTARSSLVCTVYLTQSINNYYFTMGNRNPIARAKGLLANMGTKIFHANSDFDTNQWASNMIGYDKDLLGNYKRQGSSSMIDGVSEQVILKVQPHEFMSLRYGRKENDYKVEAYILKTGKWYHTDENFIEATFKQD